MMKGKQGISKNNNEIARIYTYVYCIISADLKFLESYDEIIYIYIQVIGLKVLG